VNTDQRPRWSLGRGNPAVPSRRLATRHTGPTITVLTAVVVFVVSACQSSPPQAVDGDLRLAASAFSSALSKADASSIATLGATKADAPLVRTILQQYGGYPAQPVGYDSVDQPGKALVEFDVQCPRGDRRFSLAFSWDQGTWRPGVGDPAGAQATSTPTAGPSPSGTAEATCG
jgi:hypothetical protein